MFLARSRIPHHPLAMANFGMKALLSADTLPEIILREKKREGLFAGMAAHGLLPFSKIASAAAGLLLMIQGHRKGWPLIKGGTQQLANALSAYFVSIGGEIQTGFRIEKLMDLPGARAVVLDLSPKQALQIAGYRFSSSYGNQLKKYRYGMGVYKIDWALDAPIPFTAASCAMAGTIHLAIHMRKSQRMSNSRRMENIRKNPLCFLPNRVFSIRHVHLRKTYCLGLLSCTQWIGDGYAYGHRKTG